MDSFKASMDALCSLRDIGVLSMLGKSYPGAYLEEQSFLDLYPKESSPLLLCCSYPLRRLRPNKRSSPDTNGKGSSSD
jgi:hypothetical protein